MGCWLGWRREERRRVARPWHHLKRVAAGVECLNKALQQVHGRRLLLLRRWGFFFAPDEPSDKPFFRFITMRNKSVRSSSCKSGGRGGTKGSASTPSSDNTGRSARRRRTRPCYFGGRGGAGAFGSRKWTSGRGASRSGWTSHGQSGARGGGYSGGSTGGFLAFASSRKGRAGS